ncbi:unnamed protein product [Acidithrix sp. C25]|nr:unnamed protein product [Acidithrix sp. C25]
MSVQPRLSWLSYKTKSISIAAHLVVRIRQPMVTPAITIGKAVVAGVRSSVNLPALTDGASGLVCLVGVP